MNKHDRIVILDFGSQYTQLIARRIREKQVYCEIKRCDTKVSQFFDKNTKGIILSGGPASVFDKHAPKCDPAIFDLNVPILGICYGMQLIAQHFNGKVEPGQTREYGPATIKVDEPNILLRNLPSELDVWMSHGDHVSVLPPQFQTLAHTASCPTVAIAHKTRPIYALQFHPEVAHTRQGNLIISHFLLDICHCNNDWKMASFIEENIRTIRERVGKEHVLCGLSGGVDSSVVAALLHKAIGNQLHCVFVDTGLLRYGEAQEVEQTFSKNCGIDLKTVHAEDVFLTELAGVTDPEKKRKIIGAKFIDVFSNEARRFGQVRFLAQGTLYPDVIESISVHGGPSVTIKSHHNVGGLPPDLKFDLIEPLRDLFKDEVRLLGHELGLPDSIVHRQPFPGPGLAVRIIGEVTLDRVRLLQQADLRVQEELRALPNYHEIWQAFAVLLPIKTVGVMGDGRTYDNVVAVRAVESVDGMTADWFHLPYATLNRISSRIINEVRGINRVVYDISSKPPSTIEWE